MNRANDRRGRKGKCLLIGTGAGLLVMAAGCIAAALAVHTQKLPEEAVRYCAWAIVALSAFAGCTAVQRLSGKASLPLSLACAVLLPASCAGVCMRVWAVGLLSCLC